MIPDRSRRFVRLSHITPGSARVRIVTAMPGVNFGFATPLGEVVRRPNDRWLALDATGTSVGGWHRTRKAAIDYLVGLADVRAKLG